MAHPTHVRYEQLLKELGETFRRKDADYAGEAPLGNIKQGALALGLTPLQGVVLRMGDKLSRVQTLVRNQNGSPQVKDEALGDTLMDLASYALIAVLLVDEANMTQQRLTGETTNLPAARP